MNETTQDKKILSREEIIKARRKAYIEANREKIRLQEKLYRKRITTRRQAYRDEHRERLRAYARDYAKREEVIKRKKNRCKNDPLFKLTITLRGSTSRTFRYIGKNKPIDTLTLLGCSWEEAKEHFQKLFQPGMNWTNHGEWHIDHIIPIASAQTIDGAYKLNHISNLQPLWAKDNLAKGSRIEG